MLQKEVVERMVAEPGTKAYGRLSVMLQWRYDMSLLFVVPPTAFDPPPQVESAIVRMVPTRPSCCRATARRWKRWCQGLLAAAQGDPQLRGRHVHRSSSWWSRHRSGRAPGKRSGLEQYVALANLLKPVAAVRNLMREHEAAGTGWHRNGVAAVGQYQAVIVQACNRALHRELRLAAAAGQRRSQDQRRAGAQSRKFHVVLQKISGAGNY
jgi:hypothetical protein